MTQDQLALRIACPVCRAGVREKCLNMQQQGNNRMLRNRLKRPHRARIEKAKEKFSER